MSVKLTVSFHGVKLDHYSANFCRDSFCFYKNKVVCTQPITITSKEQVHVQLSTTFLHFLCFLCAMKQILFTPNALMKQEVKVDKEQNTSKYQKSMSMQKTAPKNYANM